MIQRQHNNKHIFKKHLAFQIFRYYRGSSKPYVDLLLSQVAVLLGVIHFTQNRLDIREFGAYFLNDPWQNGLYDRMGIPYPDLTGLAIVDLLSSVDGVV